MATRLSPKGIKVLKTCILYFCFFGLGLCVAVPGPCLLDLQNIVQTTTQNIAFIYTARSLGYLVGSILGGILLDAVKTKQAVMTICNFLVAASMLAIPWSRSLGTLTGFMIVNGLALGTVDVGANVVCLNLWGSDSGPFYQALHFSFGLGGLVAPLIAAPFLGEYNEEALSSASQDISPLMDGLANFTANSVNNSAMLDTIPSITYPFSIIGIFILLITIMFLLVCIISPVEDKGANNENSQNNKTGWVFLSTVVILVFFLLFVETGTEIGYSQMLTTYVVKGRLQLSPSTGSFMTSAFWAAFTLSRLASVFLAIKVSNFKMIVADLIITAIGSAVLLFLASYEWAVWTSSVLLGMGIASFFPAVVAWLGTYIVMTNKITSTVTVGAAFGEMLIPFTISYYIDTVPDVLIYVVPVSSIFSILIVVILYLNFRKREKINVSKESDHAEVSRPNTIA